MFQQFNSLDGWRSCCGCCRGPVVVLFGVDHSAVFLGFLAQLAALGAGHFAVGFGGCFFGNELGFALVQRVGFLGRELARSHALVNALFLLGFALVHHRRGCIGRGSGCCGDRGCGRLCECRACKHSRQGNGQRADECANVHGELLVG